MQIINSEDNKKYIWSFPGICETKIINHETITMKYLKAVYCREYHANSFNGIVTSVNMSVHCNFLATTIPTTNHLHQHHVNENSPLNFLTWSLAVTIKCSLLRGGCHAIHLGVALCSIRSIERILTSFTLLAPKSYSTCSEINRNNNKVTIWISGTRSYYLHGGDKVMWWPLSDSSLHRVWWKWTVHQLIACSEGTWVVCTA